MDLRAPYRRIYSDTRGATVDIEYKLRDPNSGISVHSAVNCHWGSRGQQPRGVAAGHSPAATAVHAYALRTGRFRLDFTYISACLWVVVMEGASLSKRRKYEKLYCEHCGRDV